MLGNLLRRFLHTTLGSNGYRLVEAITGLAGLQPAVVQPPDVILLDLGCRIWMAWRWPNACATGALCWPRSDSPVVIVRGVEPNDVGLSSNYDNTFVYKLH